MINREDILIRKMEYKDCKVIADAFRLQNWNKPVEQYEAYYKEQQDQKRLVLIAEYQGEFAGYLTIVWNSHYQYFVEHNIPEIVDLNVLIKFRKRGIASKLIEAAETIVARDYGEIGIGVGLLRDYGPAQRLYMKLGYIPDGLGASKNNRYLEYGDTITADDDLVICFSKKLGN